ncbi:hypothetical protein RCO48_31635 [Peribacillus frigoritolerans]|nr:hypothetical protein [Peribacillus frigoritolerans]
MLYGDTNNSSRLLDMIVKRQEVSSEERRALFQSPNTAEGLIASMANHEIICHCNAVSKGGNR